MVNSFVTKLDISICCQQVEGETVEKAGGGRVEYPHNIYATIYQTLGKSQRKDLPMPNKLLMKKILIQSTSKQHYLNFLGFILLILILLTGGGLFGCADHKAMTQELLSENYQSLPDDNLILYYYKLEDQIEIVERKGSGPSISLGLGLGSFGHRSGGSGGIGVTTEGSKQSVATNLRDRRNEVKLTLQQRGITP